MTGRCKVAATTLHWGIPIMSPLSQQYNTVTVSYDTDVIQNDTIVIIMLETCTNVITVISYHIANGSVMLLALVIMLQLIMDNVSMSSYF